MPAARAPDGGVRRQSIAVHTRLLIENEARKAGIKINRWRGDRPVVRVQAGARP